MESFTSITQSFQDTYSSNTLIMNVGEVTGGGTPTGTDDYDPFYVPF